MARPSKFTPKVRETILAAMRVGATRDLACQGAGIDDSTLRFWLLKAQREPLSAYATFAAQLRRAEGERVTTWLSQIEASAFGGDWRAAAWKLERLYPQLYSKAATEIPAMLEAILAKLPKDVALQVLEAAGVLTDAEPVTSD